MGNMKNVIARSKIYLKKIYSSLTGVADPSVEQDLFRQRVRDWKKINGDQTLRLDYPNLTQESIVFDLGGFLGDFAQAIHDKYGCRVYVFEPHPQYYQKCVERFAENEKVMPLNFGLSDEDGSFLLSDSADGSSFLNPNHAQNVGLTCELREIFGVLGELGVDHIDLMKINIEGGEFPLLLHIAAHKKLDCVTDFQVQFHNFIPDANALRDRISNDLSQTHTRTWCYPFVWENWTKT